MEVSVQDGGGLKTCPRCGAKLFADMDVCYGCLYDFTRGAEPEVGAVADATLAELASELEEPEARQADPCHHACGACQGPAAPAVPAPSPKVAPRAQASPSYPQPQALPLRPAENADPRDAEVLEPVAPLMSPSCVRVSCGGMTVPLEVGEAGLTLGGDADCAVVLDHPAVSARHLLLSLVGGVLVARDLGAANPVLINGWALVGSCPLRCGDVIEVRGAGVTIRPWPTVAKGGDAA